MTTCLNLEDFSQFKYKGCVISDQLCDPVDEVEFCLALEEQIEYLEAATCTKICPDQECRIFNGTGDCKLYFHGPRLQSLTSITELSCSTSKEYECPCSDGIRDGVNENLPENCLDHLEYTCGQSFPCGSRNIEICGIWGQPISANMRKVLLLLTFECIQPGITGLSQSVRGVDSISWPDFTMNYSGSVDIDAITIFPEINKILEAIIPMSSRLSVMSLQKKCSRCKSEDCKC